LPSLFATPLAGFRPASRPPGGLKAQPHRALIADLSKTALAALPPAPSGALTFPTQAQQAAAENVVTQDWAKEVG